MQNNFYVIGHKNTSFRFNIFFCMLPYYIISVQCEREKYSFLVT